MGFPLSPSSGKAPAVMNRGIAARILLWLFLLLPVADVFAEETFFYQTLEERGDYRNSCAQMFTDIRQGKPEDVGGVVRSLKYVNVDYQLRDYDNALSADPRKHYVDIDTVRSEVDATKRELYCRIELALYLKNHPQFAGPGYDELIDAVYLKLEKTYVSALKSLEHGDFARALFGFELIAPYKDAYQQILVAKAKLAGPPPELAAEATAGKDGAATDATAGGPIAQALATELLTEGTPAKSIDEPGAIALALQVGAITAAVASGAVGPTP